MALTEKQIEEIRKAGEDFVRENEPQDEEMKKMYRLGYRIVGQDVFIFESRLTWAAPFVFNDLDVAKATYVKTQENWKVFWLLSSGKWQNYPPKPVVKSIKTFFKLVEEDEKSCFFG